MIVLWGFGAFYGDPLNGDVYLKRYAFSPVVVTHLHTQRLPWLPDQIRPAALPGEPGIRQQRRQQFVALLEWIAHYERWVHDSCGLDYRRQCAAKATKPAFRLPIERLVEEWQQLAQQSALPLDR